MSRSSTEAEYRALGSVTAEILWLQQLLLEMGCSSDLVPVIFCDNRSAIKLASNPRFHERSKRIELDCHFIRHHILSGAIKVLPIRTKDQIADLFTKPLSGPILKYFLSKMSVLNLYLPSCVGLTDLENQQMDYLHLEAAEEG